MITDIAIISSGAKYMLIVIPVFLYAFYGIQSFYLRTSRQLRHMDTEARAPLNTQLLQAASGIRHIRSFQWTADFKWQSFGFVDHSQKPFYYLFCIQRWLALVLDLTTCLIAVVVVSLAIVFRTRTSESAVGLAMLNLISFSRNMAEFVENCVNVETSLGGVSRIRTFCSETPQEPEPTRHQKLRNDWPANASITIKSVSAGYKYVIRWNHASYFALFHCLQVFLCRRAGGSVTKALDNISIKIEHAQRVGIRGRTGR